MVDIRIVIAIIILPIIGYVVIFSKLHSLREVIIKYIENIRKNIIIDKTRDLIGEIRYILYSIREKGNRCFCKNTERKQSGYWQWQ